MVVVSEWKAEGKREGGWKECAGREEKKKRGVFRTLCKTSKRSSLARSVDVRVVGPLGQVASHISPPIWSAFPLIASALRLIGR